VYHISEVTAWVGVVCYLLLFALAIRVPRLRQHPESLVLFIAFCGTMFNVRGIVRDTIWDASDHHKTKASHNSFLFIDDGCYLETIWGHVRAYFVCRCVAAQALPRAVPVCTQFWLWSSMIWCFLWVFDYTIRLRNPLASVASRRKRFHITTWFFATFLVAVLLATGKIGCVSVTCFAQMRAMFSSFPSCCSEQMDGTCSIPATSLANLVRSLCPP
jgi:hypothetical protein